MYSSSADALKPFLPVRSAAKSLTSKLTLPSESQMLNPTSVPRDTPRVVPVDDTPYFISLR